MIDLSLDAIIYLRASPLVCYERIQRRASPEESTLSYEQLSSLHDLHEEWLNPVRFSEVFRRSDGQTPYRPSVIFIIEGEQSRAEIRALVNEFLIKAC